MRRLTFFFAAALTVGACAGPPPNVSALADGSVDQVLVEGRSVYESKCVQCHGSEGQGGRGKQLNEGNVLLAYPTQASQIEFVSNDKGMMPAFGSILTDAELEAVVRYTREVL